MYIISKGPKRCCWEVQYVQLYIVYIQHCTRIVLVVKHKLYSPLWNLNFKCICFSRVTVLVYSDFAWPAPCPQCPAIISLDRVQRPLWTTFFSLCLHFLFVYCFSWTLPPHPAPCPATALDPSQDMSLSRPPPSHPPGRGWQIWVSHIRVKSRHVYVQIPSFSLTRQGDDTIS